MGSRTYQLPHQGAFLNEVDATSGARCDWGRDPDGDYDDTGAVKPEGPGMAMPATGITEQWKSST